MQKRVVEYGNTEKFNWCQGEFHNLLDALGVEYSGEQWDDNFEVSKSDWIKGMDALRNFETLDDVAQDDVMRVLAELGYKTPEEMAEIFQQYLNEADPNNDFMFFSFF